MFDDNVLRFDISVYDAIAVDIRDCLIDVAENEKDLRLCEFFDLSD